MFPKRKQTSSVIMEKLVADTIRAVAAEDPVFRKEVLAGGGGESGMEPTEYTGGCKPSRRPRKNKCGKKYHKYKRPLAIDGNFKDGKFEDCCMHLAIDSVHRLEKIARLQNKRIELVQKLNAYQHIWEDAILDPSVYDTVHVVRKPNGKIKKYKFTAKTLELKLKSVKSKLDTVVKLLKNYELGIQSRQVKDIVDLFNQEHEQHKRRLAGGGSLGDIISTFAKNVWIGMRDTMSFLWKHKGTIITGLVVLVGVLVCCGSYPSVDGNGQTVILHSMDGLDTLRAIPDWLTGVNMYNIVAGIFTTAAAIGFIKMGTNEDEEEAVQHDAQALMQQYDKQRIEENKFIATYEARQREIVDQMHVSCPRNTVSNIWEKPGSFLYSTVSGATDVWRHVTSDVGRSYNEILAKHNVAKEKLSRLGRDLKLRTGKRPENQVKDIQGIVEKQRNKIAKDQTKRREGADRLAAWKQNKLKEKLCGPFQCGVVVVFGMAYLQWWSGQDEDEDEAEDALKQVQENEMMDQAYTPPHVVPAAPQLHMEPMFPQQMISPAFEAIQTRMPMDGSDLINISA